jgi:tetratricopeptide (TPR) repeat protein
LLSQGLDQLHRGQYGQARDTLLKAAALDPGSQAVREALAQADQALKLDHLNRLHREATAAEKSGQWSTALERYVAALAIDPNVGFALRGKQHAIQRITIARRIDFYLTQSDTLLNDRHLENAVQLLADAGEIAPRDAELATMMNQLDRLLTAAQTPVPVTLTSDNLTDVAVYRIGRMGRFDARNLSLRPGTYTIVGTRDGYRDVRLTVTVRPGIAPPPVHVACMQAIDGHAVQP